MDGLRRFLRLPIGWFLFLLSQWIVASWLVERLVPAHLSRAGVVTLMAIVIGALFVCNLWLRRRFLAGEERSP